jgi:hypothetical protein
VPYYKNLISVAQPRKYSNSLIIFSSLYFEREKLRKLRVLKNKRYPLSQDHSYVPGGRTVLCPLNPSPKIKVTYLLHGAESFLRS